MTLVDSEQSPLVDWGVAVGALAGVAACGDVHLVRNVPDGVLAAAVDGLGHGHEAADAAERAAEALATRAGTSVIALVRHCHDALRETRGVVMSLATFNASDDTISWMGIGNVQGVLVRANPGAGPRRETLLARAGVVGHNLPALRASVVAIQPGDLLVFATDGVRPQFAGAISALATPQRLARQVLAEYATGGDDALVLAVRYHGCREEAT